MTALLDAPVVPLTDVQPFRCLVTGSRDWTHSAAVWRELIYVWRALPEGQPLIVVHGGAFGADSHARSWALGMARHGHPVSDEGHEPDYDRYGPVRAPHVRNAEMVAAGAHVCLVFVLACNKPACRLRPRHDTHGTASTALKARAAGIEVRRIEGGGRG